MTHAQEVYFTGVHALFYLGAALSIGWLAWCALRAIVRDQRRKARRLPRPDVRAERPVFNCQRDLK